MMKPRMITENKGEEAIGEVELMIVIVMKKWKGEEEVKEEGRSRLLFGEAGEEEGG